jgi:hypothetical protein
MNKTRLCFICLAFLLEFAVPPALAIFPSFGPIPGYEHLSYSGLAFDGNEFRIDIKNSASTPVDFAGMIRFLDNKERLVTQHFISLTIPGRDSRRFSTYSYTTKSKIDSISSIQWDIVYGVGKTLVEITRPVSFLRGNCGHGISWDDLRVFSGDYEWEIRGKIKNEGQPRQLGVRITLLDRLGNVILSEATQIGEVKRGETKPFSLKGTSPHREVFLQFQFVRVEIE